MQHTLAVSHEQQDKLKELTLDQIVDECSLIDRNSKLKYGFLLLEARTRFPSNNDFGDWCSAEFAGQLDTRRATELMSLSRFFTDIPMAEIPVSVGYMLAAPKNVESGISEKAYKEIIDNHDGKVSIKEAKEIISKYGGNTSSLPANYSSESEDWYTPDRYMNTVRAFFNGIDLDPCSCEQANQTVGAENIFTKKDDSLTKDWFGKVFINPPYGKDGIESVAGIFCNKAISEFQKGNAEEVIILVNSSHTQKWQTPLYDFAVCFVDHRIKFVASDGSENDNPTFGNIFVYLGSRVKEFADHFSVHGYVMEKINA